MKNVLEFLEGTVSKYPERYAVEDENICFTWRELQECARKIGSFLFSIIAQESENLQWSRENVERFVDFVGWVKVR